MIIKPKTRGFICTTAHPQGCKENVMRQINYVEKQGVIETSKRALIIGASTGYGLASRIALTFGSSTSTIGVSYERMAKNNRTATAGWYNTVAFEEYAEKKNVYSKSFNGDAFSDEVKKQIVDTIKNDLGSVDLVIYSLAAPKKMNAKTNVTNHSVIKPIGETYTSKTVNFHSGVVDQVSLTPASLEEISDTVEVMGGQDWYEWITFLHEAGVLEKNFKTVAYSYIGPQMTHAVYKDGTIGRAKEDLEIKAEKINELTSSLNGQAFVSVNKALVTQSSSAIPVVPLYISILFKVMKEKQIHEDCIQQAYRLMKDFLYQKEVPVDEKKRIRIDDFEMKADVQASVLDIWEDVDGHNIDELSDLKGYRKDFYQLFGFELENVNYELPVDIHQNHKNIYHI